MKTALGLSIIIPTFNRAEFIGKCLNSTFEVTNRPLEVIVVDDGSTDDTVALAQSYTSKFAGNGIHLKVIELEHGGAQVARNLGLEDSNYERVMFLDSDDYLDAGGLDELLTKTINQEFDVAIGVVENVDTTGTLLKRIGHSWHPGDTNSILNYDWHTCGIIYGREFIQRIGGWAIELSGSQDWEIQVRAKANAKSVLFHEIRIGFWVAHQGDRIGATSFKQEYTESVLIACGLNLKTLLARRQLTLVNQFRLAARVAIHLNELEVHGVDRKDAWNRVKAHFPKSPFCFSLGLKMPWGLVKSLRGNR